jgi:predicted acetyltransferase
VDEIRTLRQEEMDESLDLSCFAFQYELSPGERAERKAHAKPNTIWGYFVDGKMAAKMTIHPMHTYINGRFMAVGGVASVATWPEFRRKGMVGQLLSNGLKVMKDQGQTVSFLHPFEIPFYRKFGWELYTDYVQYELEVSQLPSGVVPSGSVGRVTRDWTHFHEMYTAYASRYNGMLARDEQWWNQTVFKKKPGQAVVYRNGAGQATGYLLYEIKSKHLKVGEFIALDMDAWYGLWKFIANHDSMFDTISLLAPADDPLSFLLGNPRVKQETEPYFMARIVDVQAFLGQYTFAASAASERFKLHIEDVQAEWNNGWFEVEVNRDGAAHITKLEQSDVEVDRSAAAVHCHIRTLTAMLMGYKRPSALHRFGLLKTDEATVALLEQLLPRHSTYLSDYF